ncbi:MAG: hypothetical protein ABI548_29010 [Polyangiaceae bacterium]
MSAETNMREVVERLRLEGSEAILELVEFDQALEAFLQNLRSIALAFQELHATAGNIVGSGDDGALTLNTVQDRTSRLDQLIGQFLIAFEQLYGAVQSWNIADARSGSSLPRSRKPLAPTD